MNDLRQEIKDKDIEDKKVMYRKKMEEYLIYILKNNKFITCIDMYQNIKNKFPERSLIERIDDNIRQLNSK